MVKLISQCMHCGRTAASNEDAMIGGEGMNISHDVCAKCNVCDDKYRDEIFNDPVTFRDRVIEAIKEEIESGKEWSGPERVYRDTVRAGLFDRFYAKVRKDLEAERSAELGNKK